MRILVGAVASFLAFLVAFISFPDQCLAGSPIVGATSTVTPAPFGNPAQVHLNSRIGTLVDVPLAKPNGSPPDPSTIVQLFLVKTDGDLVPLFPTTRFRWDRPVPAAYFYFYGVDPVVPGVNPGDEATFRVRVWQGENWDSAVLRANPLI